LALVMQHARDGRGDVNLVRVRVRVRVRTRVRVRARARARARVRVRVRARVRVRVRVGVRVRVSAQGALDGGSKVNGSRPLRLAKSQGFGVRPRAS
jgi:hypothetical protein